jgi:hypothetical protein
VAPVGMLALPPNQLASTAENSLSAQAGRSEREFEGVGLTQRWQRKSQQRAIAGGLPKR